MCPIQQEGERNIHCVRETQKRRETQKLKKKEKKMPHPGTPAVLQPTSGRGLKKKKGGREKRERERDG